MSHFQEAAKNWDTDEKIQMNRAFAQGIARHLEGKEGALRFLDFGCGTGLLSQFYAENAAKLVGIDTTQEMLDQFNEKFRDLPQVNSRLINLEKENVPSDLGPFDVIMTAMAFHHLEEPPKVLATLKNLLAPKGKIFVIDLDKEDGSFHPDNEGMGVKHYGFAKEKLKNWGKELGFQNVEHEIVHKMHRNDRDYPVFLATYEND